MSRVCKECQQIDCFENPINREGYCQRCWIVAIEDLTEDDDIGI